MSADARRMGFNLSALLFGKDIELPRARKATP